MVRRRAGGTVPPRDHPPARPLQGTSSPPHHRGRLRPGDLVAGHARGHGLDHARAEGGRMPVRRRIRRRRADRQERPLPADEPAAQARRGPVTGRERPARRRPSPRLRLRAGALPPHDRPTPAVQRLPARPGQPAPHRHPVDRSARAAAPQGPGLRDPPQRHGLRARHRQAAGLDPEDLLLLQPTRVVPRKGIETTLQLAYELADEHVKVVVSHEEGDEGPQYGQFLRDEAERLGVDLRFVPAAVDPVDEPGKPLLADAYAAADLVSYPSRYEGFGNALLEAFFYRCPVLVNRYPVYARDIAPTGVRCIEIEDGELSGEAIKQAAAWLEDPRRHQEAVETNYQVGVEHFSYAAIRERFLPLLPAASGG